MRAFVTLCPAKNLFNARAPLLYWSIKDGQQRPLLQPISNLKISFKSFGQVKADNHYVSYAFCTELVLSDKSLVHPTAVKCAQNVIEELNNNYLQHKIGPKENNPQYETREFYSGLLQILPR